MKKILLLISLLMAMQANAEYRYVGGDISLLPEYEAAGAQYKTHDGTPVADILPWLRKEGMNAMRVRLFVNPEDYKGADADPNACQSLEYILPLCHRIKADGYALMLNFHYSDTWADPGKQWTPAAWSNLDDTQLVAKIYDYTRETLLTLKDAGIIPDFIQTGNEISFGMLWGPAGASESDLKKTFMGSDANWQRLGDLLKSAGKACREVCPDAKIVLHTERAGDIPVLNNFYDKMAQMDVDYEIIGLSYYPYWHGNLTQLDTALTSLESRFTDKDIMIVETGYSYAWEVPGANDKVDYEYSDAGQDAFTRDLVNTLLKHQRVTGLFWWWMEYNAYGTSLSGWYNAPLFDSRTGCATSALKTLCSFAAGNAGVNGIDIGSKAEATYIDLTGRPASQNPAPGIYVKNHEKVLLR